MDEMARFLRDTATMTTTGRGFVTEKTTSQPRSPAKAGARMEETVASLVGATDTEPVELVDLARKSGQQQQLLEKVLGKVA